VRGTDRRSSWSSRRRLFWLPRPIQKFVCDEADAGRWTWETGLDFSL